MYRKYFLRSVLLPLFILTLTASGQEKQDSLLNVLRNSANDTNRVKTLNELSISFRNADYKKSLQYAGEGLQLARQLNYKRGIALSLRNSGLTWYRQNDFKKASDFLDQSFLILKELGDSAGIAGYYGSAGEIYLRQQLYGNALKYFSQSLELYKNTGNFKGVIHSNINIGHTYYSQEKYEKAMEFYIKALNLAEKNKAGKEIGTCYINVANILNTQSDFKGAIQYLGKSLAIFEGMNDKYNMGVCYNNIAANYINQDSLNQAMLYLGKALQIYIGIEDKKGQAACYLNMGIVSDKNNEYSKAKNYYLSALSINEALRDKYRITTCLANLSISYLNLKDYNAVIESSERGLMIAKEINVFDAQRVFYKSLSETYDSLGNFKKAYEYFKLFKQVDDSLASADNRKQVLELEARYNSEKKEIEISNLTKDIKLQAIKLEKNRNFLIFSIVIILLVLILLLVFYRLYSLKLNSSRLLAQKNEELKLMNHTLSDSEAALKELNATKDKFFTIIAHDIKNPLSAYRSITKMLSNSFYELSEQQKLEYIRGINRSSENLYELFQNLLQWSTSQSGTLQYKPQEIDLGILAFKAVTLLQESADKKNIQIALNVKTDTYACGDINMVSTIMTNLLSNAIKYSGEGGVVEVNASDEGNYIKIAVSDNGIGITDEDIEKLFRVEIDHKTIGDSEEKGTGIGLILCKEFVSRNGGNIWVESTFGKGSTFNFTLPKDMIIKANA
ncbi:MAG: tetratricopeptide repeat-containing sensor histidine kinase [Bacteroidales bacterium]|nr:tetratricopeptide repeat-containing sensor histidine kinase [Bacteroidales bacterium]